MNFSPSWAFLQLLGLFYLVNGFVDLRSNTSVPIPLSLHSLRNSGVERHPHPDVPQYLWQYTTMRPEPAQNFIQAARPQSYPINPYPSANQQFSEYDTRTIRRQFPIVCGRNEMLCDKNFCFDRTCEGRSFPSLKNGQCRCIVGYMRYTKRDFTDRQCVCQGKCYNDAYVCPDEARPPIIQQPPIILQPPACPKYDLGPDSYLYQLYHRNRHDHLYASDRNEVTRAIRHQNYIFEGPVARMPRDGKYIEGCPQAVPLYRWYKGNVEYDHFYSTDEAQAARAKALYYRTENIIGYCVKPGPACGANMPLHRFWNKAIKDHFYTVGNENMEETKSRVGYTYEGVECYVWWVHPSE